MGVHSVRGGALLAFTFALFGVSSVRGLAPLEPVMGDGAWFGVSIDFSVNTVESYTQSTGVNPVIYSVFVPIPLDSTNQTYLEQVLPQIQSVGGVAMLTLLPYGGLAAVTDDAISLYAGIIKPYEEQGTKFMIRYAHEMNGNWYPWGQQPTEYISSFQQVASALRAATCQVAMVWAPNGGQGYPWTTGGASAGVVALPASGTPDFEAMDTNGDGEITQADNPFSPFYPGDSYVDWVGMSVEHFGGSAYPYTSNQPASAQYFTQAFTGNDGVTVNFYTSFCSDGVHNKPFIITETSSEYLPSGSGGTSDLEIKQVWWEQVYNIQGDNSNALDISQHFPMIKAILWFDELKDEAQSDYMEVDWRYSGDSTILSEFISYIDTPTSKGGMSDFQSAYGGEYQNACSSSSGSAPVTPVTSAAPVAASTTLTSATESDVVTLSPSPPPPVATPTPTQTPSPVPVTFSNAQTSIAGLLGRRLH